MNILNNWRFQRTAQSLADTKYSLVSQPPYLGVSENILSYKFTPRSLNIAGTKAYIQITVVNNPMDGSTFMLSNNNGDNIALTASVTPSTQEFLTFNGLNQLSRQFQIAQSLANELLDSSFRDNYEIWVTSNVLHIRALDYGPQYTLSFSNTPALILTYNVAGSNNYQLDSFIDYSLYAKVIILNTRVGFNVIGGNVDRTAGQVIGEIILPYYGQDWYFNIDGYLKNYVGVVVPTKNPNFNIVYQELDKDAEFPILRGYYLSLGDSFRYVSGGERKRVINACTDVQYVQNGALDLMYSYNMLDYTLEASTPSVLKFLNKWNVKDTRIDANEFLQFIESKNNASTSCVFGVEVTFRFIDGTIVTRDTSLGNFNSTFGGNISIDVSPRKVKVDQEEALAGVWVDYYDVRLYWQRPSYPRYYSEIKRFIMKRECGEHIKNFIWFNELGAWDSITVKDNMSTDYQRELIKIKRITPLNPSPDKDITRVININYDELKEVSTFELDKANYVMLEGLFKSTAVYLYDPSINTFVPVIITDNNYSNEANKDIRTVTFKYKLTYPSNIITR
jgi:hypothetical protein